MCRGLKRIAVLIEYHNDFDYDNDDNDNDDNDNDDDNADGEYDFMMMTAMMQERRGCPDNDDD